MPLRRIETIEVPGKLVEADSFAACVRAALEHWGRQVPYDCVLALSGTAFCPPLDSHATCPGMWMETGSDVRVDFLGHALGFTVERGSGHAFRRLARRTCHSGKTDAVLLCKLPTGWGILSAPAEGSRGYSLICPGHAIALSDLPPEAGVYVLRPTERSLTSCEALRATVQFGALVATGNCEAEGATFGGRLYEVWAEQLKLDIFCPECGENEWRCARRVAGRARGSHLSAIHFLNRAYAFLPRSAESERLRDAACTFAVMADTLAPYTRADFQHLWHSPAGRTGYANGVEQVRDLHRRAAEHLVAAAEAI